MDLSKIAYTPPKNERKGAAGTRSSVRIEWTVTRYNRDLGETVTDERTLRSTDQPHPDFLAALAALKRAVVDGCMLVSDDVDDTEAAVEAVMEHLTVRSVTMKELPDPASPDEPTPGVTITALRALDWSGAPLVLNTPFAPVYALPTDGLEDLLDALTHEAVLYVNGKRAQGDLFAPSGDGAPGTKASRDVVRAVRDLAPDGKNVSEVTISSGGRSVTLTPETREKAQRALDSM